MSFRASLSVFLGCNYGQAQTLLSAAERGEDTQVKQVLQSKPELAAFAGFQGTTSPLHRAASAGHLSTCIAIIELIKLKIAATKEAIARGKKRSSSLKRWTSLLSTVINQRTHRGQTPLMLACERGYTDITAYLLAEGADALVVDMIHARTALHYAAIGGHSSCVRVLCSDAVTVLVDGTPRPLRDVVTADLQVQTAKYIDQRSMGGLTALHFAAVSGNLETVQSLLRGGASIMVKTDGEAFIGQEYLTPGSTPLHIAVLVGSMPLAHAILQAHAEMMTVTGSGRDERRRRPWEGHSRSDIRSVRNSARKLPYHLSRDRGWAQMMHLVDPRVPVDAALDAARDTDHGIGPKNLATICSIVLQQSLLQWLDQRETEIEAEREVEQQAQAAEAAVEAGVTLVRPGAGTTPIPSPRKAPHTKKSSVGVYMEVEQVAQGRQPPPESPFAAAAAAMSSEGAFMEEERRNSRRQADARHTPHTRLQIAASAPVTPQEQQHISSPASLQTSGSTTAPPGSMLSASRMESLHTYLGMLSVRRPPPTRSESRHQRRATLSWGDLDNWNIESAPPAQPLQPLNAPSPPSATTTSSTTAAIPRTISAGDLLLSQTRVSPDAASSIIGSPAGPVTLTVAPSIASGGGEHHQGTMRRVLSTLMDRLRTPDATESLDLAAATGGGGGGVIKIYGGGVHDSSTGCEADDCKSIACGSCSDAGTGSHDSRDQECGVCLDHAVEVAFAGCEHALCLECARNLTKQEKKPPSCPFCRRMVVGFVKVRPQRVLEARRSGNYEYI